MVPDLSHKRFGFLMFNEFEELDLIGPWEMATMWAAYAKGPACVTVSEKGGPLRCAKGLTVAAEHGFASVGRLDYLMVPGGFSALMEAKNPALVGFVRDVAADADAVLSVCTGSFILKAAGLLEGRRATTHWKTLGMMRKVGVDVEEARFVQDGPVWTSAGVSAGIDMTLAFIAAVAGEEAASLVQHNAEYYPDGTIYGTQAQAETSPAYVRALAAA